MPDWLTTSGKASEGNKDEKGVRSFSLPWVSHDLPAPVWSLTPWQTHVLSVNFHQPLFSSNHISLTFHPVIDGGLPASLVPSRTARSTPPPIELKLVFREGRVHECYKMMEECRAAAKHGRQEESAEDGEPLREWRDGLTRCEWVLTPRGSFVYAERVWCRRCVDIGAVAVRG